MGTRGREIVGKNAERTIELLNKAFSDEWLAYYQYWIGSKIVAGPMKDAAIAELMQHAADELRHADMLSLRIIQLGGTPITTPKRWFELGKLRLRRAVCPVHLEDTRAEHRRRAVRNKHLPLDNRRGRHKRPGHLQPHLADTYGRGRARRGPAGPPRGPGLHAQGALLIPYSKTKETDDGGLCDQHRKEVARE